MPVSHWRCLRARARGFTLVELMTVVAITGILATIGVVLVKGHVRAAKASRALVGIQAIRVAEEQYRAQTGQYLGCPLPEGPDSEPKAPAYYPMTTPSQLEYDWRQPSHSDWPCWQRLGIPRSAKTQYGYLVHAGMGGDPYPTLDTDDDPPLPSPAPDLWYVIQVKGDIDEDETLMRGVATSYGGDVYLENESE